jgi:hypothetical protein
MSKHLFATIVTATAVAANKRGEGTAAHYLHFKKSLVATINTLL